MPLCCRLLFALQWKLFPDYEQAVHRGTRINPDGIPWVPCGIFHHPTISHADYERQLEAEQ